MSLCLLGSLKDWWTAVSSFKHKAEVGAFVEKIELKRICERELVQSKSCQVKCFDITLSWRCEEM